MICGKCNTQGILNSALGQEFYYCTVCKDEIGLGSKIDPFKVQKNNDMIACLTYNWNGQLRQTYFHIILDINEPSTLKTGTVIYCDSPNTSVGEIQFFSSPENIATWANGWEIVL